ncbi:hypothetical protein [Streptomyces sp. MMG1121]|uniref:hypothetical protein n=1 Tax=Streptomyces sp. MMG1121 TaxID=1415544 RepID=UPI0006C43460|nr:hypothetical protein [Streptomyces sp. MMG1121]KOV62413.1 hypothetical protein ADK64_24045 [Streptomyces sp. MMG1121]
MRLNQLPDGLGGGGPTGGGQPGLASSPAEKQAAANTLHNHIEGDTKTAGAWADDETGAVVKAFAAKDGHGWLTSGAVGKAHTVWGEQMQSLVNKLSGDESALRNNNTLLMGTDFGVSDSARKVSVFDAYSPPPGQ